MTNSTSFGQINQFDELSNKMFFNIFVHKPDSTVFEFVKKYFPTFTEKYEPGGWTMYPQGPLPIMMRTVHSFVFKQHPYFEVKFREGRLDLLASEEVNGLRRGIRDFQLWFMFDTKNDAQTAFTILSEMFDSLSKSKKMIKRNGKTIAEYSNQPDIDSSDSVLLILTKDELLEKKYKLFFKLGNYQYLE